MNYLTFGAQAQSSYKICILVNDIRKDEILRSYIEPYGLDPNDVLVISLHQAQGKKKTPAAEMKAYIQEELNPVFQDMGVEYLLVADGDYFKCFSGATKVDAMLGYMLESRFGDQRLAYVPNFRTIFYDPIRVTERIALGVNALKSWMAGTYRDPGVGIIEVAHYPMTATEIETWLKHLLEEPTLSADIEAFSLKHYSAGIGTITFCWSKTEGIAFPVDILNDPEHSRRVRAALKRFFERYQGTLLWHNIAYDVNVLVYQLFMEHLLDNEGLLRGLEVMLPKGRWHCTKLISYLATNSCAGNKLSLKDQAQEWAGDYAQENIKDIRKIPLPQLLQYNLVDGLSTWFVFEKHWGTLLQDQQLDIYETLFQPATVDIVQMQLTGMPVDYRRTREVRWLLYKDRREALRAIRSSPLVQRFTHQLQEEHVRKRNEKLKTKRISMADDEVQEVTFNPNSDPQLRELLYGMLGLPAIDFTDSKLPATGAKTLEKLLNHTESQEVKTFLQAMIAYAAVDKILTSFIPAMLEAQQGNDGWHYLFGNFNLGGTVSGRLSSSNPNLQNLPANSKYAKLIKSCFAAPPGWHFCGIDFASLEDRISALTTKDPNKLRVYTQGYDGHSLRAYAYFGGDMPDIDPNSVDSINSIATKYKSFRQDSKAPTFALTYQGTYKTLMNNCGFGANLAKSIEASYHELYKVSDDWVADKLNQASQVGYITAAFGLRVRTPLLYQVIRGTSKTPFEAEAEGRTAGNALGQSWCLLNSRAGSDFMGKVRSSQFRHDIKPCSQIHDAQYYLVRDDIDAIVYANENVVEACEWQNHSEIWHDEVKLGGEFSIFWPNWSQEVSLPNGASAEEIYSKFEEHVLKQTEKAA